MESTPETDKTTLFFLSPSAASIYIIYHSDMLTVQTSQNDGKGMKKQKYALNWNYILEIQ